MAHRAGALACGSHRSRDDAFTSLETRLVRLVDEAIGQPVLTSKRDESKHTTAKCNTECHFPEFTEE